MDGDGIGYRTLPGTEHPLAAYFARGTGHNEWAVYSERPDDWEQNMERLSRKLETARTLVPAPIVDEAEGATVAFIVARLDRSRRPGGPRPVGARRASASSYLRVRALPFTPEVRAFAERLRARLRGRTEQRCAAVPAAPTWTIPDLATRFRPLNHNDGLPLTARWIVEASAAQVTSARFQNEMATADMNIHRQRAIAYLQGVIMARNNQLIGLERTDYKGNPSTLCQGCGHDSISAGIIMAAFEMSLPPHQRDQDERHRLLVQEPGLLYEPLARLQLGPWAHALGDHRRD